MTRAYGARPHWGKVCPLPASEIAKLYPRLPEFRRQCAAVDPHGVFVNDFARHTLGFSAKERGDS
jgi:xylitol oxidase